MKRPKAATDLPRRTPFHEAAEELAARTLRFSSHPSVDVLASYRARELAEAEADRIRVHLGACASCSEVLLDLARLDGELEDEHAPHRTEADLDEGWQRLEARIRRENPKEGHSVATPNAKIWQALAAGLFLAVLGLGSWGLSLMSEVRDLRDTSRVADALRHAPSFFNLMPTRDALRSTRGSMDDNSYPESAGVVYLNLVLPNDSPLADRYTVTLWHLDREGAPPISDTRVPLLRDGRTVGWATEGKHLPRGGYRLRLYRGIGADRVEAATYDFRIVAGGGAPP